MSRQGQVTEFNTFVKGLFTEASPLTYPEGTAIDINNFELGKDGSVKRRLGFDREGSGVTVRTSSTSSDVAYSTFVWENVNGDSRKKYLVVQVGNELTFLDMTKDVISKSKVGSYTLVDSDSNTVFSYANVDGVLVVASNSPDLHYLSKSFFGITGTRYRIQIRDLFGVQDGVEGFYDYRDSTGITSRRRFSLDEDLPTKTLYNYRNKSWTPLRYSEATLLNDPLYLFADKVGVFPSYADNVNSALFPDPENSDDRNSDRLWPEVIVANGSGTTEAPDGHFVIDALERGGSRFAIAKAATTVGLDATTYPQTTQGYKYGLKEGVLPVDRTPNGASVIAEYAGRVWYAGFSGEVIGGDRHSPRLSSYVMFSKQVEDLSDLSVCYQVGDPTSKEEFDLVDTDGGFIRIDEAYGIKALVNVGDYLLVMADNGVWSISGGSDYGFTATDYKVSKISDSGIAGKDSWVVVDKSVLFWAQEAIYQVGYDQTGMLSANDLTNGTIKKFYDSIGTEDKRLCKGMFDSYERKIIWTYGKSLEEGGSKELILDVGLGAFYKHTISPSTVSNIHIHSPFEAPAYKEVPETYTVKVGNDTVDVYGSTVIAEIEVIKDSLSETAYVAFSSDEGYVDITIVKKYRDNFKDWYSLNSEGVDSSAYLITGYYSGGDYQRSKQVPYVTFHFNRTEDGFIDLGDGDIDLRNQSSCKVRAQWDWSDSINSGRWSKEFQAYRFKRHYIPESVNDSFDYGFSTIVTKNKIRGKGKVVSFHISTEEGKDCQLLGWSMFSDMAMRV